MRYSPKCYKKFGYDVYLMPYYTKVGYILMDIVIWDIMLAVILGAVEGLTEFIPVSSSGHMIIAVDLLAGHSERIKNFEVIIQLGSIMAVIVVFWKRITGLLRFSIGSTSDNRLSVLHLLIGMIPASIVGLLSKGFIKKHLFGTYPVVIGLILGGILMIIAEKSKTKVTSSSLDSISYNQAFWIGCFQCFSLWPGFSRSGSTISGGILSGLNYKTASEFSFLVAIPIMFAATTLTLVDNWSTFSLADAPFFITGLVTAWAVAMLVIKFFLRLIVKVKLVPFAIYRFILAGVIIAMIYAGYF